MTYEYLQILGLFDDMLRCGPRGGDVPRVGLMLHEECDYVSYDGTRTEDSRPVVHATGSVLMPWRIALSEQRMSPAGPGRGAR
ncbi:hypothetical protein G352_00602 [Rhodococcus ruber BKS 20-38]|uniref:Uncharacterized protein n=1 Tax=Rhodococcus ruber BKS 20-38 TaxID=1278076 RepID=M3A4C9_9NOCA|nr:hypothetical protein G352_00602 [Rhodococcus ruber BKS 20-38]